jgi:hypothetical protein
MANSRELESQIKEVERLDVRLVNENGRQVRGDSVGFADYPYKRAANETLTVAAWKNARFFKHYEGYDIEVLDENGDVTHGRTILANVRGVGVRASQTGQITELEPKVPRDAVVPSEIHNPELVCKLGGMFPSIEVSVDHLPYDGAFEDAIYAAAKTWVGKNNLTSPATIWTLGSSSCDFPGLGQTWSVFVLPFGFGSKFPEFLRRQLAEKLSYVRNGPGISLNPDDGWRSVCHIQDGTVYQVGDVASWFEVME